MGCAVGMRAVVQRVARAACRVDGEVTGSTGPGLLVFLGVQGGDTDEDQRWLLEKLVALRIFADADGRMNVSVRDAGGGMLVISQFTLFGDVTRGTRPSFNRAAPPEEARARYEAACIALEGLLGKPVGRGVFAAMMEIEAINDGPVTLLLDSRQRGL